MTLPSPALFAWLDGNGTVRAFDGLTRKPMEPIGRWKARAVGRRFCVVAMIGGKRWRASLDWAPPRGKHGLVVLLTEEFIEPPVETPASTSTPTVMAAAAE